MSLPYHASVEEIAAAIVRRQSKCRVGKISDPTSMAIKVRTALDNAEKMAHAIGMPLKALAPEGYWWDGRPSGDATIVRVLSPWRLESMGDVEIEILRSGARTSVNGWLKLTLKPV